MLPTEKQKAKENGINSLLLIGATKIGKTHLVSKLPDNIILGFERGAEMYDNYRVMINSLKEFGAVLKELKTDTKFKYVTIDTITSMEEYIYELAEIKYSETILGKHWFEKGKKEYKRIDNLPNGAGYRYIDEAINSILDSLEKTNKTIIFIGHLKFSTLEKDGIEVTVKDVDVMGRMRKALVTRCEAIAFIERRENTKNYLSFRNSGLIGSSWVRELSNKDILISEFDETTGDIKTYWDSIFSNKKVDINNSEEINLDEISE